VEDDHGHALVLDEKCTRNPIQVREMADDHDVVFEPGGFSPKGIDIVVRPDAGYLLP